MLHSVFLGTPEISLPALRVLHARSRLSLVVTQPDRPAGRGHRLRPPPVKLLAQELGLPVWQPERLRGPEAVARFAACDVAIVMAYGQLLPQALLDAPRRGCINLHASLLPRWRGASPLQAALAAGDVRSGVSVMRMVRALDAGPVILQRDFPVPLAADLPWLHDRVAAVAAEALAAYLDDPERPAVAQEESQVTVCRKLLPSDGRLDPQRSAGELARQLRAYHPAPGCWLPWPGGRLRVEAGQKATGSSAGLCPGELLVDGDRLLLVTADGLLELLRIQAPGARAMAAAAFLRGHQLPAELPPVP